MSPTTRDAIAWTLLEALRLRGPVRGPDLVIDTTADGYTVGDVVDVLAELAFAGHAEVRTIEGMPYWTRTPTTAAPEDDHGRADAHPYRR